MSRLLTWFKKPSVRLTLRFLIGIAFLYFLLRFCHLSGAGFLTALLSLTPQTILIVTLLNAVMMLTKAVRLCLLFGPEIALRPLTAFLALLTASAVNNVAPARAGEIGRVFYLEKNAQISKTHSVAVAILEKLFELFALTLLVLLLANRLTPVWMKTLCILGGLVPLGFFFLLPTLARFPRFARLLPASRPLRSPWRCLQIVMLSAIAWLVEANMIVLTAQALGLA